MNIQKLDNGTLLVPRRVEQEGVIGDTMVEIAPDHAEYEKWMKEYEREQSLDL